jgi:hypothetical protein
MNSVLTRSIDFGQKGNGPFDITLRVAEMRSPQIEKLLHFLLCRLRAQQVLIAQPAVILPRLGPWQLYDIRHRYGLRPVRSVLPLTGDAWPLLSQRDSLRNECRCVLASCSGLRMPRVDRTGLF